VHEIECWLLPIYYSDKIGGNVNNCIYRVNEKSGKDGVYINSDDKKYATYDKISKAYIKHKNFMKLYANNPSLKIFRAC
jgi:hypothetical protein